MSKKAFLIISFIILLSSGIILIKNTEQKNKITPNINRKNLNFPSEWYDYQRTYPYGKLNHKNYLNAMRQVTEENKKSATNFSWEFAGPTNIGGRITDIEIHPDHPNTLYVGAASGGIFKTTDEGINWYNIFTDVPTIGIGDIAIDPNNENIIYAGTGESNASSNTFTGSGIYKSTDAGTTWNNIGLENSAYIGRIIVDYDNSSRIFVAACGNLFTKNADRGIYRTTDEGNNWEKILFLTDSTSGIDLVQHPENPDILYAAMWERFRGQEYRRSFGETSGIWKTTDGGDNWTELTSGLPTGNDVGRIGITISESNPNTLYAIYDKSNYDCEVYKTTNAGDTWTQTSAEVSDANNYYGWYFGQIRVDPQNENRIFAMGMNFYKSENGGSSWTLNNEMHVDHHAMEFTNNKIWCGNDGGLYYSTNNGSSWNKVNNLPLTQFYDIAIDSVYSDRLYGGTQDNNSIRTATGNINEWEVLLGGDGMYCLVDYTNPNIFYCEYQNGGIYRIENGNYYDIGFYNTENTNWATPYILHPTNPNILYVGTYRVQKSTNKGDNWTAISGNLTKGGTGGFHTITTIEISQLNPDILITGSADGKVFITTNDGTSWTDITDGLPDRWITRVKTDPFDVNTIYVTVSGFRWDEHYSHIFKSADLGQNWTAIDGNLPEIPINTMVLDPDIEGRIFVGTDAGVYMTNDSGTNWEFITNNLPNVPVFALEFHHAERKLFVGTFGLGAYKTYIPSGPNYIDKIETNDFINIYPNPVNSGNYVNISFSGNLNSKIDFSVSDISGKIIFNSKINKNSFLWKTSDSSGKKLSSGIYICNFVVDGKKYNKKIIIK